MNDGLIERQSYPLVSVSRLCSQMDEFIILCREDVVRSKKDNKLKKELVYCSRLVCAILPLLSTHHSSAMCGQNLSLIRSLLTEDRLLLIVRFLRDVAPLLKSETTHLCNALILLLYDHAFSASVVSTCLEIPPSTASVLQLHIVGLVIAIDRRRCSTPIRNSTRCFSPICARVWRQERQRAFSFLLSQHHSPPPHSSSFSRSSTRSMPTQSTARHHSLRHIIHRRRSTSTDSSFSTSSNSRTKPP